MNKKIGPTKTKPEPPFCSFCGKGSNQVKKMVQGPSAYICSDCIENYRTKLVNDSEKAE
ncbi:MAG: hypothetical protein FHK78_09025 [Sedimenticola selenatireducens]|uniref:ClpX-type ZB domain-containing protein n=2 Tax=Sedimenticola selenatireducens TaxID=191960 RepID=A0A557SHX5_9GAMM|nr:ClpX C4-type zinc finger protein [Sedimenticola selenatireducens]TVO76932.1 hypothetical protein FHP88_05780 [Sedimenticola selenatireducens]TVT64375.1 MAG: hypothetical protein FHK78_09025 [Sedimenticola selenatireducens]